MKEFNDYPLEEEGKWKIYGEDPNCDMMGHHHEPYLGLVEGRYIDAIVYAKSLSDFTQWGGGGRITKYVPLEAKNVHGFADSVLTEYRQDLEKRQDEALKELEEINKKLGALELEEMGNELTSKYQK